MIWTVLICLFPVSPLSPKREVQAEETVSAVGGFDPRIGYSIVTHWHNKASEQYAWQLDDSIDKKGAEVSITLKPKNTGDLFYLVDAGNGYVSFKREGSDMFIDTQGNSRYSGKKLNQYYDTIKQDNQKFKLEQIDDDKDVGPNTYYIKCKRRSDLYIGVDGDFKDKDYGKTLKLKTVKKKTVSLKNYVTDIDANYKITLQSEVERLPALETLEIAEGSKTIQAQGFENLPALKTLKLPPSLTRIYGDAFKKCTNLESVMLPDNLYNLVDECFYKKTKFIVKEGSKVYKEIFEKQFWAGQRGYKSREALEPEEFDRQYSELWGKKMTFETSDSSTPDAEDEKDIVATAAVGQEPKENAETGSIIGGGSSMKAIVLAVIVVVAGLGGFMISRKNKV